MALESSFFPLLFCAKTRLRRVHYGLKIAFVGKLQAVVGARGTDGGETATGVLYPLRCVKNRVCITLY